MNIPKLQKFYVHALFKSNYSHDNMSIKSVFKSNFQNIKILFCNMSYKYYRYIIFTKKINNEDIKININSEKKLYIQLHTTEEMENRIKDENFTNYFIDLT